MGEVIELRSKINKYTVHTLHYTSLSMHIEYITVQTHITDAGCIGTAAVYRVKMYFMTLALKTPKLS